MREANPDVVHDRRYYHRNSSWFVSREDVSRTRSHALFALHATSAILHYQQRETLMIAMSKCRACE